MSHTKMLRFIAAMLAMATLPAGATNTWVAQPRRAESVEWPIPAVAGRDFWTVLSEPWLNLPGVKDEKFVQDSGLLFVKLPLNGRQSMSRMLALREIEIFQAASPSNVAPRSTVTYASEARDVMVFHPERINDGNRERSVSISASQEAVKERYRPFRVSLQVELPAAEPLAAITLYHGASGEARLASVDFYAIVKGKERLKLEPATLTRTADEIRATFTNAPATGSLLLDCLSAAPATSIGTFSTNLARHCQTHPFFPDQFGDMLGLGADNFDAASWNKFLHDYRDTYMGFCLGEWDSGFFHQVVLKWSEELEQYGISQYTTRREAEAMLRTYWDNRKQALPGPIWGLSGQLNYPQYGAAWGGNIVAMELAGNSPDFPHRSNLLFTRGGARQYDKPWLMYLAYYVGSATADSKSKGNAQWPSGLDYGIAPSLGRRLFYMCYYQGVTFLTFESQPWGQVKQEVANGPCSLTENGKAIKDIYEWAHSEKGRRGTCYTPILFLMDYWHGHDEWRRGKEWNTWYRSIPFTDGDYMAEHFLRTIDPFYGTRYDAPPFSANLHNSRLGDIFDLFFANPPEGSVKQSLLSKYPVVIPLDDIAISTELAGKLKDYVKEGGTLLLNSAQCNEELSSEEFLGLDLLTNSVAEDGMSIRKVKLTQAQALLVSSNGLPLLTKNAFGKGHVLLTTPPFLLMKDKQAANPLIEQILLRLQAEVLPVSVEGDIQFLFNKLADGTWRIVLINNKGVLKKENESVETRDPAYATAVRITAPAKGKFTELMAQERLKEERAADKKIVMLTVPPGEVRILEVKNLPAAKTDSTADKTGSVRIMTLGAGPILEVKNLPAAKTGSAAVGAWSFDEGKGTNTVDSSGNGYNGVIFGAQYVTNRSGHCMAFNGKDNYITLAIPAKSATDQGTFEAWACPTIEGQAGIGIRRGFVMDSGNVMIFLNSNRWGAMIYDGVNVFNVEGPVAGTNQWAHLAVTWSSDNVARFYVDGQEVERAVHMRFIRPLGLKQLIYVGVQSSALRGPFRGLIDDVRIYDRELTAPDIQQRYQDGLKQR